MSFPASSARLVVEDDQLAGVELDGGRIEARSAVFIRPTNTPHAQGHLAALELHLDSDGFITVDRTGRTSAAGVWAAGNVVDPRMQVITAAGAGSAAAIAINAGSRAGRPRARRPRPLKGEIRPDWTPPTG